MWHREEVLPTPHCTTRAFSKLSRVLANEGISGIVQNIFTLGCLFAVYLKLQCPGISPHISKVF